MAHTPGPWRFIGEGHLAGADGSEIDLFRLFNEPDARLIAAAPELLGALKALMHEYVPADDSEPDPKTRAVIDRCRAAIQQAE